MKLSVIIPVYNGADFIEKSYYSIISQGIDDIEILYVDNNSTDNSIENILILQKKDPRISLYYQKKQGAGPTRNLGITAAKGEYIYLFDVDDEIFPEAINRMIGVLDIYSEVDAVFGKMVKSYQSICETNKPLDETHEVTIFNPPYWGLKWFKNLNTVVGPPAFLYRKGVLEKIGLYNEDLRIGQDTALDIILGMTSKLAFLDTYIYLYYKHTTSNLEQSKSKNQTVFHLWNRLVLSHLPFYLSNEVPLVFKLHLFNQLFSTMAKVIFYSKGLKRRYFMFNKTQDDIKPICPSILIKIYLLILVILPHKLILKLYVYYISKWYVKNQIDNF